MRKKKAERTVRTSRVYSRLGASWEKNSLGRSIDGYYVSEFGYVRIYGADTKWNQFVRYTFIADGIEYWMNDPVARSEKGICSVASRFARDVVNGRYDHV